MALSSVVYLSVCVLSVGLNEPWSEHCSAGVGRGGRGDWGRGCGNTCKSSEIDKGQQQGKCMIDILD
jgi:hypothetical protein